MPASLTQLGFKSQDREVTAATLELQGDLPAWLRGSLLRTGPAKFEVGEQRMRHWFDGLAMLHRFTIDDAGVNYGCRFLGSSAYRATQEAGEIAFPEFATDPCRSLFKRAQTLFTGPTLTDNANVNVVKLGERMLAMTETPLPVQFDRQTLEAASVRPFMAPGQLSTAHPHLDRRSGAMLNYAAKLGVRSSYRFFAVPAAGGKPQVLATLPVREPAYMHSFGLTERWFVLAESPLRVDPKRLILSGRPYIENYVWKPQLGLRFTLIDRTTGEVRGPFQAPPAFTFHHVNAYEEDGSVVVDLCAYDDAQIIEDLYLDHLRAGKSIARAELRRYRLDLSGADVSVDTVCDGLELPRINYHHHNERPYRYVWGNDLDEGAGFLGQIVRVDLDSGETSDWSESGCYAGEPVFVPRPDAEDEDDGVLLSVVLDGESGGSFLLVLDARTLGELARAHAPHHIPLGFHGSFSPA